MKPIEEIKENIRLHIVAEGADGLQAYYNHPKYKLGDMPIIFSFGGGWEHASVSLRKRCPTWDEMCDIKDIFWGKDETVVQYHPPETEYVNNHPYCLHLWKKIGEEPELPPSIFVGFKKARKG